MDRREALRSTAWIMGYAVSASAVAGVMSGCGDAARQAETALKGNKILSDEQLDLVGQIAEAILAKTETPGALDVNVHHFIDGILPLYKDEERSVILDGLATFVKNCNGKYGKSFSALTSEEKIEFLTATEAVGDQESKVAFENSMKEVHSYKEMPYAADPDPKTPVKHYYSYLKELVLLGFFTSEEVTKSMLGYNPIPGKYDPCLEYDDSMPAWYQG